MVIQESNGSEFLGNRLHAPMLLYIADHDGCMLSELYRDTTGNRSRPDLLRALECAGAVALVREGRITKIELTDKGRRIVEQLKEAEEIFDS